MIKTHFQFFPPNFESTAKSHQTILPVPLSSYAICVNNIEVALHAEDAMVYSVKSFCVKRVSKVCFVNIIWNFTTIENAHLEVEMGSKKHKKHKSERRDKYEGRNRFDFANNARIIQNGMCLTSASLTFRYFFCLYRTSIQYGSST